MPTKWFFPNTITQYAEHETHVKWTGENNDYIALKNKDARYLTTTKELLHIANPTTNDLKMKTYFLKLSDFRITNLPETISGIEAELSINRGGRITDDTIQLIHNDIPISKNKADYHLDVLKIYGNETDLWETQNLTPEIITDSSFGVLLRFQSHPSWPHRENPKLDYLQLRVW